MLQAGHYDADAIRECAEKVAMHWQQLMLKMEDRLKLVNASVAFYKTSEQVSASCRSHTGFPAYGGTTVLILYLALHSGGLKAVCGLSSAI